MARYQVCMRNYVGTFKQPLPVGEYVTLRGPFIWEMERSQARGLLLALFKWLQAPSPSPFTGVRV